MSWSRILGHDAWINAFRAVTARSRLAHAYLFLGPPGVGKRHFAVELAKALLCENPPAEPALTACDQCASCLLVDARTHPDFFLVGKPEDKNNIPIDTMRELCAGFRLTPARGHGKIAILDDADDLEDEAANCFLKTLEEPPPRSVFILIGTSLERQLATIRSRCQMVRFAPLPGDVVRKILEATDLPDRTLVPRLVKLAGGSPGHALALTDPALWQFRNRLLAGLCKPRVDSVSLGREFVEFVEDAGKETVLHRARASLTIRLFLAALRDGIQLGLAESGQQTNSPTNPQDPTLTGEEAQLLQALARRADPEKWLAVVDRCLEAETQLDRYIQVGLVLEGLLDALGQLLDS